MGEVTRNAIGPALGAEIRAARERARLGVREAARRLRIEHSYLIALERGERAPSAWTAGRLIDVLALEGPTAHLIEGFGRRVEAGIEERRQRVARPRRPGHSSSPELAGRERRAAS
jgi:transcriptional regulator with XRE-family HTH domain